MQRRRGSAGSLGFLALLAFGVVAPAMSACAGSPPASSQSGAGSAAPTSSSSANNAGSATAPTACDDRAVTRSNELPRTDGGTEDAVQTGAGVDPERRRAATTKNACEVADDNLGRATSDVLAGAGRRSPTPHRDWDRTSDPEHMALLENRYRLTAAEKTMLHANGFVALGRISHPSYAWAMHEIYQSEMPIYISMDSLLFAVFSSNDNLIASVEERTLAPLLASILSRMHCALAREQAAYPKAVARDLDVYLTVARSLLESRAVHSVLGTDAEARTLVAAANAARPARELTLFGRPRYVDWSQYAPRGHYASAPRGAFEEHAQASPLGPYFRASMWLSRLELNLVSRSSRSSDPGAVPNPSETPQEANVALALADLADKTGTLSDVTELTRAWTLFAGKREDVSLADLVSLRKNAGITVIDDGAPAKLRAAIGNDFQRTARFHRMPEGSRVLPAISTMLGPRVTPDAAAFRPIVNGETPGRYMVHAGDVGAMLGLDLARKYIKDDIARFPNLSANLDLAKKTAAAADDDGSLYYAWFSAVRNLSAAPAPTAPAFMRTPAFQDATLNSLVAGYGEIRHNYVLMAGQPYDEGGCEIPDGFVEPRPETLAALRAYATRGKTVMRALDPKDALGAVAYFGTLESTFTVLQSIVTDELEGRPLSPSEKSFLGMVAEMAPGGTGGPPTYTGWYFDLFRLRDREALTAASFIADYYTSSEQSRVAYLGTKPPIMGAFVVDTGGPPRVMVGPIASAYEATSPLASRLSDETAEKAEDRGSPWAASYVAPPALDVAFAAAALLGNDASGAPRPLVVRVRTKEPHAAVRVELLDHHRKVVATMTKASVAGKRVEYKFAPVRATASSGIPEGVRVSIGEFSAEQFGTSVASDPSITVGGMESPSEDWQ